MQSTDKSLLMALPTELRCYIYDYFPERVFKHVFPTPGICTWAALRMPTALLQVNKTILVEAQEHLRTRNMQKSPKVTIGPVPRSAAREAMFTLISDIFHEASKRRCTSLSQAQKPGDDNGTKLISLVLASWYNEIILPLLLQNPSLDDDSKAYNQRECTAEELHPFVGHTLRRMERKRTCEISIRMLFPDEDDDDFIDYCMYEMMLVKDITRRALSAKPGLPLKIIPLGRDHRHSLKHEMKMFRSMDLEIRRMASSIRIGRPTAQDLVLFRIPSLQKVEATSEQLGYSPIAS
ncbi:uncharacterized protein J4E84_002150 [Alternaria hordeiaustralica]|uniref:uncharacterized protein n=1 Tax=Alternaria hordeiaustralica TaxID=1187925 RepID=UPI0020C3A91E|nr:uncharacterized protein J4E84_002150 [Alternaria hordeiaustralica]KAI4695523.1 hypothetical protein J4E84_002150 [Alternaria hordeiaustralica]